MADLLPPIRPPRISRAYRDGTMVLETIFDTADGRVALIDFMPIGQASSSIIRLVEGRRGKVAMRLHLTLRFDYGTTVPWVTQLEDTSGLSCSRRAEPGRVARRRSRCKARILRPSQSSTLSQGAMRAVRSDPRPVPSAERRRRWIGSAALRETEGVLARLVRPLHLYRSLAGAVQRSLLTLKALTYAATGGIVAAPTTSLPEQLGGERNWDYRYCWLRDATLTLLALMSAGYIEEAQAWRAWLQRSVAGSPSQIQIMYGLSGERQLIEWEVPWLPGYQGAARCASATPPADQLQLDVFGSSSMPSTRRESTFCAPVAAAWAQQQKLIEYLERIWRAAGRWNLGSEGWTPPLHLFKVMAWVALDRTVRDAERFKLQAPLERWRQVRDRMHATICEQGFDGQPQHLHPKLRRQRA